jgi:hypothetical protein
MQEFDVEKPPMTQGERSVPRNKIKLFHVSTDTLDCDRPRGSVEQHIAVVYVDKASDKTVWMGDRKHKRSYKLGAYVDTYLEAVEWLKAKRHRQIREHSNSIKTYERAIKTEHTIIDMFRESLIKIEEHLEEIKDVV